MTAAQAGWYPDPEDGGLARYWDGTAWTRHVQALPPPPPPVLPAADPRRPTEDDGRLQGTTSIRQRLGGVAFVAAAITMIVAGTGVLIGSSMGNDGQPPAAAEPAGTEVPSVPPGELPDVPPSAPRSADPAALEAAGCRPVDPGAGGDRSHLEGDVLPPPAELYEVPLPAWGPHTPQVLPLLPEVAEGHLDPRVVLHNLEHGAVVVWFDPDAIDADTIEELDDWLVGLLVAGFWSEAGSNLYVSPAPPDTEVAPISLRAWGVAVDCPGWDGAAADAFVAEHYGSRGDAPEEWLGPYPEDGPLKDPDEPGR